MSDDVEPACTARRSAEYHDADPDHSILRTRNLCSDCFPDNEIGDDVDEICYTWRGAAVHQTLRDAGEKVSNSTQGEMPETTLAGRLADPDVTSISDLKGGDV